MFILKEKEIFKVAKDSVDFFNAPTRSVFNDSEDYEKVKKALEDIKIEITLIKKDGEISIISAKAEINK